ncbi:AAA family ATPase [Sphingobacterium multivorum]|uniref:AAA family ATPase n=1 Tax=Sphingobacterium multivorum TaxID=28454 RepID=UPI0028A8BADC|nr:ATP-binding protein [Sphingobacterium multivorum]
MTQQDYLKDIIRFGLENQKDKLVEAINKFIDHNKNTRKINFALQLQAVLKESQRSEANFKVSNHKIKADDDLVLERLNSDYRLTNIILDDHSLDKLKFLINEHRKIDLLSKFNLPVSNKVLLHGPSGCGKTLASYVIAGELNKPMIVVNLGSIVSSKLGETSKNISSIFSKASQEGCIIFIDEFDSVGKLRDYDQDHGEMKRVVNTILQLFDYLPQSSMVICATNQKGILDGALIRRFDYVVPFELPKEYQIKSLIELVLKDGQFVFDNVVDLETLIKESEGLPYSNIQKTLITTLKQSILESPPKDGHNAIINSDRWKVLLRLEKYNLGIK